MTRLLSWSRIGGVFYVTTPSGRRGAGETLMAALKAALKD